MTQAICGWYSPQLDKTYKDGEKYSLWDKVRLWWGVDKRRDKWTKIETIEYPSCKTGGLCVGIIYQNGLGEERAEVHNGSDVNDISVDYLRAKSLRKTAHEK